MNIQEEKIIWRKYPEVKPKREEYYMVSHFGGGRGVCEMYWTGSRWFLWGNNIKSCKVIAWAELRGWQESTHSINVQLHIITQEESVLFGVAFVYPVMTHSTEGDTILYCIPREWAF